MSNAKKLLPSLEAADIWADFMNQGDWQGNTILLRARRIPGRVRTMRWDDLETRSEFLRSQGFAEIGRLIQHDHPMTVWQWVGPDHVLGLELHKSWGEPNFTRRDRNRLHLFNLELHRLIREGKLKPHRKQQPKLSRRQQQMLDRLLVGDRVKEAVVHMGISRRTAEDYVKDLYRLYDVHSRAELMARFVRKSPVR